MTEYFPIPKVYYNLQSPPDETHPPIFLNLDYSVGQESQNAGGAYKNPVGWILAWCWSLAHRINCCNPPELLISLSSSWI